MLCISTAVNDLQILESRDSTLLLEILFERVEDDLVVRPVVAGVEAGQPRVDGGVEVGFSA
ncbi:hypothetical protein [Salinigranum rubrum]|uniref:hypothetical protein n=1 Tax=Salinigranum rubrum TaxID=755307 RepID=UPI0013A54228|nr:hypothetical protein [Salinigranum rubrum]